MKFDLSTHTDTYTVMSSGRSTLSTEEIYRRNDYPDSKKACCGIARSCHECPNELQISMEGLSGSLIHWLKTFNIEGVNGPVESFFDGVVISKVLNNIDSEFFDEAWLSKIKTDAGANWRLKVSNLKKILKGILDYYNEQITGFRMPDVAALGEKSDIEELGRLLQLVLGCAVNCTQKHEYIEALMGLEENIQHDVMNAIQELMTTELPAPTYQSETYVDLNNQLKGLTQDLHSTKESKEQITQRCHELDMQ
ncbi:protein Hook homolog 3, partial [Caerostris extrusa]